MPRTYIQRVYTFLHALGLPDEAEPDQAPQPWTMHYMAWINRGARKLYEAHGTAEDRGDPIATVHRLADEFDDFLRDHGAAIAAEMELGQQH